MEGAVITFDKLALVAWSVILFFVVAVMIASGLLVVLALPFLGVMLAFYNPWIGVPVTVVLSLVSLAFAYMFAYLGIDEARGLMSRRRTDKQYARRRP